MAGNIHQQKASKSFLFVICFIVCVMSVRKVHQALTIIPELKTDLVDEKPQLLPSSEKAIGNPRHNASSDNLSDLPSTQISQPPPNPSIIPKANNTATSLISMGQISQPPPISSIIPNANNTAISLISMGRLVNTFLVERCIRSIRRRGQFTGTIMVFTDSIGYKQYQDSIRSWDNRTIIIQGYEDDMNPRDENNNGQLKKYAQKTMIFKRFKTLHSKYIADYPELLGSIRYVMYVDTDNIIGSRLDIFFEDYIRAVADQYNATDFAEIRNYRGFSFASMFRDRHLRGKMHSGIIIYDLDYEEGCVNAWRHEMDTFWDASDQSMLLRVIKNFTQYHCHVFPLPPQYMSFASKGLMTESMLERQGKRRKRKPMNFPTFIHVTSYRVRRLNNATVHNEFIKHLLQLEDNEMMTKKISWDDVVFPHAERKTNDR